MNVIYILSYNNPSSNFKNIEYGPICFDYDYIIFTLHMVYGSGSQPRVMTHDPHFGHCVFCLCHEPISKNIYLYIYIYYSLYYSFMNKV